MHQHDTGIGAAIAGRHQQKTTEALGVFAGGLRDGSGWLVFAADSEQPRGPIAPPRLPDDAVRGPHRGDLKLRRHEQLPLPLQHRNIEFRRAVIDAPGRPPPAAQSAADARAIGDRSHQQRYQRPAGRQFDQHLPSRGRPFSKW